MDFATLIIIAIVLSFLGMIGTVFFWIGVAYLGVKSVRKYQQQLDETMRNYSASISRLEHAYGGKIPPEGQEQIFAQYVEAQNQISQFDRVSQEQQDLLCSDMIREASAAGIDVSNWNVGGASISASVEKEQESLLPVEAELVATEAEAASDEDKRLGSMYDQSKSTAPRKVQFAVFSPECITLKSSFVLDVWAFLPEQFSEIFEIARSLGRDKVLGRKFGVLVDRGSILTVRTEISGLRVQDPIDAIVWDGEPVNASFIVEVPERTEADSFPGKVLIGSHGITIAKIVFLVEITPEAKPDYTHYSQNLTYPKTAFASYASENRNEILTRVQGMKKIAPELDIFIDVFSLRSGQNWEKKLNEHVPTKDVFYLFWSRSAAESEWVEREWRMALAQRGIDYINPVPLEAPDDNPPPGELSSLHFNDAYLSYLAYDKLKQQMSSGTSQKPRDTVER